MISTRKIGNFGKHASHAEAVRFSPFQKHLESAKKGYIASGSVSNEIVPSGKNPLEQNPEAFMKHVRKDLLPRLAEVIEENGLAGSFQSKGFQMPRRPLRECIEKRVELPGKVISSLNKHNFFTNIGEIMDAVPNGFEVKILWQPFKGDPSNLFNLNFNKGLRSVPGIDPFKDFTLVVRVSGKATQKTMDKVLKVFVRALSNQRFLCAGSVEVERMMSSYAGKLSHLKITKLHRGFHGGRKKAVKFADTNNDHVFHKDDVLHEEGDDIIPVEPDNTMIIDLRHKPPRTI